MSQNEKRKLNSFRDSLHEVIFEADTKAGKLFDVILLIAILASVIIVIIESVPSYHEEYGALFIALEWAFTVFFTIEYGLRLYAVYKPMKYAKSFFGIIDLMSILPTYLSLIFVGTHSLMIVRGLRLLRVFRIFKLANFLSQGEVIMSALKASRDKIFLFVIFILIMVSIFGSIMYLVEGASNDQFDSIPRSIYWAIVTLTTVGYGDISPVTPFGQAIAAIIMISGYAIIAVPTGIVTAEAMQQAENTKNKEVSTQSCRHCSAEGHDEDAEYCKYCGESIHG
ncbi:MAG: voltage-gated potassium channel [Saprospiraceae bacterium]|jgi:voltage-gated potassium channel